MPEHAQQASIAELAGACQGALGILAAEGPSLAGALPLLSDATVRERFVLVCTATGLRPLVSADISPDAVVLGVDEPDIEAVLGDLPPRLLRSTTVIAPAVLEPAVRRWWSGPLRLSADGADGSLALGSLGTGRAEERAHRLLRHVGCDPVALVGVDPLGTDGVWHARGTALDSVWSAQLNPFLSLATLEWRLGTSRRDQHDAAMRRVRAVVSADRDAGLRVLDTSGGAIAEAEEMPVREVLRRYAVVRAPLPLPRRMRSVAGTSGGPGAGFGAGAGFGGGTMAGPGTAAGASARVAVHAPLQMTAFVIADPEMGGTGVPRRLDSEFGGRPVLVRTIERLAASAHVDRVVVVAPEEGAAEIEALAAAAQVSPPPQVIRVPGPFRGQEAHAIAVARAWADSMWGGGIGGATVFDEMLVPRALLFAMERTGVEHGLVVGADWPLVLLDGEGGIQGVVARFAALGRRGMVFGDAPPGLSPCCMGRDAVAFLAARGAGSTLGATAGLRGRWAYDLRSAPNWMVHAPFAARIATVRAVFDSPRAKIRMRRGIEPLLPGAGGGTLGWQQIVPALERQYTVLPTFSPQHLMVELCTGRFSSGSVSSHRYGSIQRRPMTFALMERILGQVADARDTCISFSGLGDPMRHPDLPTFIRMAKAAGVRAVHVRTELLAPVGIMESMLEAGVDVVSVELHAACRETYRVTMGVDRYEDCMANVRRLLQMRSAPEGCDLDLYGLPYVVPRMQRRSDTVADVAGFIAEWAALGTAVLEGPTLAISEGEVATPADRLADASTPARTQRRELWRRMRVLSDGRVPAAECDITGATSVANLEQTSLREAWKDVVAHRRQVRREHGTTSAELWTATP